MHSTQQRRLLVATAAGLGLALAATVAAASPNPVLPGAIYSGQANANGPNGSSIVFLDGPGTISSSTNNVDGQASDDATAGSSFVSANASSTFAPHHSNEGNGAANETYYFMVVGAPNETVRLLVNGGGSLYSTGGDGSVEVIENFSNLANYARTCSFGSDQCGAFSYSQTPSMMSNTLGFVHLGIFAAVQNGTNGGSIDPTITIDPTTPDANLFHLEFSDGFSGAGAVPEPASWALMIAGFGLAGAALRRRQAAFA